MAGGTKVNARDTVYEVDNGAGTWIQIGDLDTAELDRAVTADTDITTFASAGQKERMIMERDAVMKIAGKSTGDAGQARIDALADLVGAASIGLFRITLPKRGAQTTIGDRLVFNGVVDPDPLGGANNDPLKWGATISRSGPITKTAGS